LFFPFLQNFVAPHPNFFTEAWSLSIEEYAYLLLPAVIYLLINLFKPKSTSNVFLFTTILVIGILLVPKYYFYLTAEINSYKGWSASFRKVVIYRLDAIYYGFILIYLVNKYTLISHFRTLLLVFGSLIFILIHIVIVYFNAMPNDFKLFYSFLYLPLISISLSLLFPWFLELKANRFIVKFVEYLSTRSYAIYLVNYSLVLLTVERYMTPSGYAVLIYLIVSLILSEILYKTIELPMLKLRDRIVPR
jgi:peptidoglycan/LPS O-acetylase OafA/YrhL